MKFLIITLFFSMLSHGSQCNEEFHTLVNDFISVFNLKGKIPESIDSAWIPEPSCYKSKIGLSVVQKQVIDFLMKVVTSNTLPPEMIHFAALRFDINQKKIRNYIHNTKSRNKNKEKEPTPNVTGKKKKYFTIEQRTAMEKLYANTKPFMARIPKAMINKTADEIGVTKREVYNYLDNNDTRKQRDSKDHAFLSQLHTTILSTSANASVSQNCDYPFPSAMPPDFQASYSGSQPLCHDFHFTHASNITMPDPDPHLFHPSTCSQNNRAPVTFRLGVEASRKMFPCPFQP